MYTDSHTSEPCPVCGGLMVIRRPYTEDADGRREWQTPVLQCPQAGHYRRHQPRPHAAAG